MSDELVKPPFTRYYLRQHHGLNRVTEQLQANRVAPELITSFLNSHNAIKELDYILVLKPSMVDERHPQRTSNHYIMFVSIMQKYEEQFEKELFKLSLTNHAIEIAKKETIEYLRHPDGVDW